MNETKTTGMDSGQTPIDQNVLAKIKKLFALAGNNPNEAEATAALGKAQELLARHNLNMAQLDSAKTDKTVTEAEGTRQKTKVDRSAMFTYQRKLWDGLATSNFCVYWSQKVLHENGVYSTHHHYMIGREANVETVKVMGVYLEQAVNRLCPYKSGKDVNLWKTGCVDRIVERLAELRYEMDGQPTEASVNSTSTTAVALRDVRDAEVHGNHMFQYHSDSWCPCSKCAGRRNLEYQDRQRTMPAIIEEVEPPAKTETESQRKRREEKEARDRAKWQKRWDKQYWDEHAKRSSTAYQAGRETGNEVGLNSQVKGKESK